MSRGLFFSLCLGGALVISNPTKADFNEYIKEQTRINDNSLTGSLAGWLFSKILSIGCTRRDYYLLSVYTIDLTPLTWHDPKLPRMVRFVGIVFFIFYVTEQ